MQLNELYGECCIHHADSQWKLAAKEDRLSKQIEQMVERLWDEKKMPPLGIDKPVVAEFAKKLWDGVEKGYGKKLSNVDYTTPDGNMLAALQDNVWQFAAAKNRAQLIALSKALVDDTGKLRTYNDFKKEAFKINDQHVNQWLQTEYELAVAGGQMCAKWVNIEAQADTLPLLEFDAVIDQRTSDLCRTLHKTILPFNHPFWDTYYPPNHFKCRSTVWQRRSGKITPENKIQYAEIPAMFRVNLAKERLIFPPKHPYFDGLPNEVMSFGDAKFSKDTLRVGKGNVYESGLAYKENKNPKAHNEGLRKLKEYHNRKDVANALADYFDKDVFINPEFNNSSDPRYYFFYKNAYPLKQPDFTIAGEFWEMESYDDKFKFSKVGSMLKKGAEQSDRIVLKLNKKPKKKGSRADDQKDDQNINIETIAKKVKQSLDASTKHLKHVKEVLIVDEDNVVHRIL